MSPSSAPALQLATTESEFKKNPDLKKEDIAALRAWLNKQPHLPKIDDDIVLIVFLRSCNLSIEKTKTVIDNFYTFRTHVPEMSLDRNTRNPDIQQCFRTVEMVVLEQTDPFGNAVFIQRLRDTDVSQYNPFATMRVTSMVMETFVLERGSSAGGVLVLDHKGFGLGHVAKLPISAAKRIFYYMQECIGIELKRIHIVNANSYIEKILAFFRPFMNKHIANAIRVHKEGDLTEFYKDVPREILPKDYGGPGKPLAEQHDEAALHMEIFNEYFEKTDKMLVDESKRPGKAKNSEALFGVEGSFKKLNID